MSVIEVLLRFGIVAGVFAVSMLLLRRYGLRRQQTMHDDGGVVVTGRVSLSRGVQLLTVKAGRASFLVSSGGRVAITPIDASNPSGATTPSPPTATSRITPAEGPASLDGSVQDSQAAASYEEDLLPEPSGRGLTGWASKWGYRIGLRLRRRFRTARTEESPTFADVLGDIQNSQDPAEEDQEKVLPVKVESPRPALNADVVGSRTVRADVETFTVIAPAQPAAPTSSSVLLRATLNKTKRRPRPRKNRVPERDPLPGQSTRQARKAPEREKPEPSAEAAQQSGKAARGSKKTAPAKETPAAGSRGKRKTGITPSVRGSKARAGSPVPAPRHDVSDPLTQSASLGSAAAQAPVLMELPVQEAAIA